MEKNQSYFSEALKGVKSLLTGFGVTMKEYFTPKITEQYPENRNTRLHVAARHRGRLIFNRDENGQYLCTACTLCEKTCPNGTIVIKSEMREDPETGKKKRVLLDYQYDLGECMFCQLCVNACNFNAIASPMILKTRFIPRISWYSTSIRRNTMVARCPVFSMVVPSWK